MSYFLYLQLIKNRLSPRLIPVPIEDAEVKRVDDAISIDVHNSIRVKPLGVHKGVIYGIYNIMSRFLTKTPH